MRLVETHVRPLGGPPHASLTAGGRVRSLVVSGGEYRNASDERRVELRIDLVESGDPGSGFSLWVWIPGDLADGLYEAGTHGTEVSVGQSGEDVRGTVAFKRSRDLPLVDVRDPRVGEHRSTIEIDLALRGNAWINPHGADIPFTIGPMNLSVAGVSDVEMAQAGPSHW